MYPPAVRKSVTVLSTAVVLLLGACLKSEDDGGSPTAAPEPAVTAAGSIINDTGITASQCFQAGSNIFVACDSAGALSLNPAQDGMTGRDADPDTNAGSDGKLGFSYSAVPGGCVRDNVSGLMWEVKSNDGGLRRWDQTYTNFGDSRVGDASAFVTAVNAAGLCEFGDWRLPTAEELQSLVDYGVAYPGPTIDSAWFSNTRSGAFWSSSPYVGDALYAWGVYFNDGLVSGYYPRSQWRSVRLVRGVSPAGEAAQARFALSTDGQEATDGKTGLIWRRCPEGMVFSGGTCTGSALMLSHEAAMQRATGQETVSGKAWRLPNVKELTSIVDRARANPSSDPVAFPATPLGYFWSSSPRVASYTGYAWSVNFYDGGVNNGTRSLGYFVRLVRAAQ